MNTKSARKNAKTSVKAPLVANTPAPEAVVEAPAVVAPAPAPAPVAPVVTEEKVTWADTMKKAQASFAKTGAFREGTNRFVLYPLLCREQGLSLSEAAQATQERGGKSRSLSSIHTDLHDIAKITQRKLVRADQGEVKRYRLAPVAPAQEEVK
jgi:hypothetical protein